MMLANKESSEMVNIPHGQVLKQEFLKDQFLVLFFFLIFVHNLSDNLISNPKLFADDASVILVVQDITLSAKEFK